MYVCVHTYLHINIHIHAYTLIHTVWVATTAVYTHVCMLKYVYVLTNIYIDAH